MTVTSGGLPERLRSGRKAARDGDQVQVLWRYGVRGAPETHARDAHLQKGNQRMRTVQVRGPCAEAKRKTADCSFMRR